MLTWRNYVAQTDLTLRRMQALLSDYLAGETAGLKDADASIEAVSGMISPSDPASGDRILGLVD